MCSFLGQFKGVVAAVETVTAAGGAHSPLPMIALDYSCIAYPELKQQTHTKHKFLKQTEGLQKIQDFAHKALDEENPDLPQSIFM